MIATGDALAPRLATREISKAFPGMQALDRVSLEVAPGEIHALLGENGAGKSTLGKIVAGVYQADGGKVTFDGRELGLLDEAGAAALGIGIVHQEGSLVPQLSVAENVFAGHPPVGRLGMVDRRRMRARSRELLEQLGVVIDPGLLAMMSIINADNMREAVKGFTAYIEASGGGRYEIVANEDDNGDASVAAQKTAAVLAAHPDIAGVAGFDSESGAGIVLALQEAGKEPGEVTVTAMEQTPDFFKRVEEGWVEGVIVQNRELFIYYAVKMLHDFNHNGLRTSGLTGWDGVPIPPTLDTGVLVVSKANVGKVLQALAVN